MSAPETSSGSSTLALPRDEVDPVRAIVRRVAIGVGILLVIAVLVWVDRDGYTDIDDDVSFLDALYYATVSASTTGFGEIAPRSDEARLVNVLVVTPLRVAFLIVLVGTTLEVATRASRQRIRVARWHARVRDHTVIVGFGTMGQAAARRLVTSGTPAEKVVVVARDPASVAEAGAQGFVGVRGDGAQQDVLMAAAVDTACCVVVAVPDDATAVLITLTARRLTAAARLVGAVAAEENAELLRASGADAVMLTDDAAGRQLALCLTSHAAGEVYGQLLDVGHGLDLAERQVRQEELGLRVNELDDLVLAVVRDGRVQLGPREAVVLAEGDRLAVVTGPS